MNHGQWFALGFATAALLFGIAGCVSATRDARKAKKAAAEARAQRLAIIARLDREAELLQSPPSWARR